MFTGIIEKIGEVVNITKDGTNKHFYIKSSLAQELKIDQSVAHNGVCLTVVGIENSVYQVTAIHETLLKTNLNKLALGDFVNLERCMPANGRFDGHMVYGHVDTVAVCNRVDNQDGSTVFTFGYTAPSNDCIVVEKGSICLNGISLTVFNVSDNQFSVAVIPYTLTHTNLKNIIKGDEVNIEFDILGKYITKVLHKHSV